jgi:hypothetical protein
MDRGATAVYFARLLPMIHNSTSNEHIREFVQIHLGCACPDRVFDSIDITEGSVHFDHDSTLYQIGDRLLVAVLKPQDWRPVCAGLAHLIETGKYLRDQHGYNRFRLVIATDDNDADIYLQNAFKNCSNTDDKTHLHVIHPRVLPFDEPVHN